MNRLSGVLFLVCGFLLCFGLLACGSGTPKPPADFTLTATPATITVTPGTSQTVSLDVTPSNQFAGTVAVTVSGLPAGVVMTPSTLILLSGTPSPATLTAAGTATAGTVSVILTGKSGILSHSATVALTTSAPPQPPDVTTYHYDNARDGLNAAEIILTPADVNSTQFGKIGFDAVDGAVDAEPLYVANLNIAGKPRNVLYVATEHDSVYAFDADSGSQIWTASTLGGAETTSDTRGCGSWTPEIGITATPVIDRKRGPNGTLFTVAMSKDASGAYHQRLHGLDLTTGQEVSGSPSEITGSFPGTGVNSQGGTVTFDPAQYSERAALLLLNGNIYLTWTSHCDYGPYNGWVMAYGEATLQQTQILNLTPNGTGGAIWMSAAGPAADSSGNIYLLDGNGTLDQTFDSKGFPSQRDFGSAMLKLSTTGSLAVADYFAPFNAQQEIDTDADIGSGGALLLPDLKDATGNVRHLIAGAGKDTQIYLADRDNLGKFNSSTPNNSNVYQNVIGAFGGSSFSTPAYFNGVLYYGPAGDVLRSLPISAARIEPQSSQSTNTFPYPGATPGVSANGTTAGIVWALESNTAKPGILHAYDASNLLHELYNSEQAPGSRDGFGNGNKFITPLIVNGKVYVGTPTGVAVFGLLPE